jgi:hypothetical protein
MGKQKAAVALIIHASLAVTLFGFTAAILSRPRLYRAYLTENKDSHVDYGIWQFKTSKSSEDPHIKDDENPRRLFCNADVLDHNVVINPNVNALFLAPDPSDDCRVFQKGMCSSSQFWSFWMISSTVIMCVASFFMFLDCRRTRDSDDNNEPEKPSRLIYLAFLLVLIVSAWQIERHVSDQVFHDAQQQTQCGKDISRALPGVHAPDMRPDYNILLYGLCTFPTMAFIGFLAERAFSRRTSTLYSALHQLWF